MAKEITFHIGPFKTGTTTIQQVLLWQSEALQRQGTLYPRVGSSADHWLGVGGLFLLSDDTLAATFDYKRQQVLGNADRFDSGWRELRQQIEEWPGRAVVSCESLAMGRPSLVKLLTEAFPNSQLNVIVASRAPSKLVSSWYQETAKRTRVVPFPKFVRNLLRGLLTQEVGPYDWMSTERVRRVWDIDPINFRLIGNGETGIGQVIEETLSAVGLHLASAPPSTNPAMSRCAVAAWQDYLEQCRPTSMRLAHTVRGRAFASSAVATDPRIGGAFALHPDLAVLVDDAFNPIRGEQPVAQAALARYLQSADNPVTREPDNVDDVSAAKLLKRLVWWDRLLSPPAAGAMWLRAKRSGTHWESPDWSSINNGYV